MKKLMFIASIVVLIASCKPSQIETLITDYEQNFDGTSIDLNLKINSLEKIGVYTGADSLSFYSDIIDSMKREFYPKSDIDTIPNDTVLVALDNLYHTYKSGIDLDYAYYYPKSQHWLNNFNSFKSKLVSFDKFSTIKDSVLFDIYKCNYTIKNPMLNNAEQTITSKYFILSDESKIIGSE